jgi:hypothetical protein
MGRLLPRKVVKIMADNNNIVRVLKSRQCQMRREMDRRGLSLKGISFDSGIGYSTLLSYFPSQDAKAEPALMPVSAQYMLCGAVPDDILSLLLPDGRLIVRVPEQINHDEIAAWAEEYNARKLAAHRADSECQEQIGPNEKLALDSIVVAFPGKAA